MGASQIKATVSDPVRISPEGERNWFPRLFTLPDGRILQFNVTVDDTTDALKDERGAAGRIADANGQNWQEIAMPRHFCFPVTLKSGAVRGFSYIGWHRGDGPNQVAASADFDPVTLTWTERPEAVIRLPT